MGGNLLKTWGLPDKRLSPEDYELISRSVVRALEKEFEHSDVKIGIARSLRNKESHGDLDITVGSASKWVWKDIIETSLGITTGFTNSNVYSFPYNGFQVDITQVPPDIFKSSMDFFDFGDTGNMVGRMANASGVKYGHDGLSITVRQYHLEDGGTHHVIGNIPLTTDTSHIHKLFYLDHERWLEGFDTEEDVFHWIAASEWFDPNLYDMVPEFMDHANRVRNKKRAMFSRFSEWCKVQIKDPYIRWSSPKAFYDVIWTKEFPFIKNRVAELLEQDADDKAVKAKLNGNIVMVVLDSEHLEYLTNKKIIGAIISFIRGKLSPDKIKNCPDDLMRWVIYETYQQLTNTCPSI